MFLDSSLPDPISRPPAITQCDPARYDIARATRESKRTPIAIARSVKTRTSLAPAYPRTSSRKNRGWPILRECSCPPRQTTPKEDVPEASEKYPVARQHLL